MPPPLPRITARRLFRFPWRTARQIAADVDDELQFHLDMRIAELMTSGHTPETARAEAMRRFGDLQDARNHLRGVDAKHERSIRVRDWLASWAQDVQFSVRQLRRAPTFTAVAVLTLALGIGMNTAIFSVVHRLLVAPYPYPDADRVVVLVQASAADGAIMGATQEQARAAQARARSLEGVAEYDGAEFTVQGDAEPEVVSGGRLTPEAIRTLGMRPILGRGVLPGDTVAGAPKVALLGYGLWRRRYGGDREVLGRTITIDGDVHTIVGVMPREFGVPFFGRVETTRQLWTALQRDPKEFGYSAVARLRPGATMAQVERELAAIGAEVEKTATHRMPGINFTARRGTDFLGPNTRGGLLVLLGAVGLVLLIACANVANLLLARAAGRQREFAVRTALGAARGRIVRQLLTESVLLAAVGGALGLLLAWRGLDLIIALRPPTLDGIEEVRLHPVVLGATLAVTLLTGLLFGLAPALFATDRGVGESLKGAARSVAGQERSRRFRATLVTAEIALSAMLLVGAGLLVRSLVALQRTDVGFEMRNLMSLRLNLPEARYDTSVTRLALYDQMLERVRAMPGVVSAVIADGTPLGGGVMFTQIQAEGQPASDQIRLVGNNQVDPTYFRMVGLPIREGRPFAPKEEHVVIVGEGFAKRFWAGQSALGKKVKFGKDAKHWTTVVGVARDVTPPNARGEQSELQAYFPFDAGWPFASLVVRTDGERPGIGQALTKAVLALDPAIRVRGVQTVEDALSESLAGQRFNMALLTAFAALALVLAAVGLYGVISYSVSQRTREIGVRIALGAQTGGVVRLVLSQGLRLTGAGLLIGLAAASYATRVMQSMLHGVSALDPATFAVVGLLLAGVALAATWLPARRAAKVDPIVALREE